MTKFAGFVAVCAAAVCLALPAQAQAPSLAGSFSDWFVYTTGSGANRVCYALGQPRQMTPQGLNRDPAFFLISTFPGRKVSGEPSVVAGYPYKDGSRARIEVGSDKFDFFTKTDNGAGGAWLDSSAEEKRLIDTMKRGSQMSVTGTSARGTMTRDTYSLKGISAALDKMNQVCK